MLPKVRKINNRDFAATGGVRLLRAIAIQSTRTRKSASGEAVHDLRVSIRRLRHILSALKDRFPGEESRRLRGELKVLMTQAGDVRDRDISIELIRKAAGANHRGIIGEFRTGRDEAAKSLRAGIRDWKRNGSVTAWRAAMKKVKAPDVPIDKAAHQILMELLKDFFRQGRKAAKPDASMDEIHRFRIAGKNLRYALDFFIPLYGDSADELMEYLKETQKLVGEIHDCAVAMQMVEAARSEAGKKEIRAALKKRLRKKTERFQRNYGCEFSNTARLRHWKKSLSAA